MAREDALRDKILKLGSKQKISAVLKYMDNPSDDIRMAVAMALGMIPTYESGMGLIELLRDPSPFVRVTAINSASAIHAKNCEEYIKKLAMADPDPNSRQVAKKAYESLKDNVITY
jgi:HEAT repeat protein